MAGHVHATEPEPLEDGGGSHLRFPEPRRPVDGEQVPQRPRPRPFASCLGPVGVALTEAAARHETGGPHAGPWAVQHAEAAVDALVDALPAGPVTPPDAARASCQQAVDRMPWSEILALLPAQAVRPTGHGILAVLDDEPSARRISDVARKRLFDLRTQLPEPAALRTVGALAVVAAVVFFAEGPLGREPEGDTVQRCTLASLIADSSPNRPRGHVQSPSEVTVAPGDPAQLQQYLAGRLDACLRTPAADPELLAMRRAHAYAVGYRLRLALAGSPPTGKRVLAVEQALRTLETGGALDEPAKRLRPRWYER